MKTSTLRSALLLTAASASVAAASLFFPTTPAQAADCQVQNASGSTGRNGARSGENDESLACGTDADASGGNSVAVGTDSESSGSNSTAVGHNAIASGTGATALGKSALAQSNRTVAIGHLSKATSQYGIAIGYSAKSTGDGGVAIGDSAKSAENSVAVGLVAGALDRDDDGIYDHSNYVAVGAQATIYADHGISVGRATIVRTGADRGIAIGSNAIVNYNAEYAIALGADSFVGSDRAYAVALGAASFADEAYSVSLGHAPESADDPDTPYDETQGLTRKLTYVADGTERDHAATVGQMTTAINTAIGSISDLTDYFAVDYTAGYAAASATGADSVAVGAGSEAVDDLTVSLGFAPQSTDDPNTPFDETQGLTRRIVNVTDGTARSDAATFGQLSDATDMLGYVVIDDTVSNAAASAGDGSIAIGPSAVAEGEESVVIGDTAKAYSDTTRVDDAVVIGNRAAASFDRTVSIGTQAQAYGLSSTAVGDYARALETGAVALGHDSQVQAGATNSVAIGHGSIASQPDTFSVGRGSSSSEWSETRRIVNVTDGTLNANSSDAVTGAQLFATNNRIAANEAELAYFDTTYTGTGASALGTHAMALGQLATVGSETTGVGSNYSIAIGHSASVGGGGANNIAIGRSASVGENNWQAVSLGHNAASGANQAVALGAASQATAFESVALGSYSIADEMSTVSFGADGTQDTNGDGTIDDDDLILRRLVNVADGEDDSDAVTVSQLNSLVGSSTAQLDYFVANDTSSFGVASVTGADSVAIGAGSIADGELTVSVGRGETSDGAGDGITRRLVNVADGINDSDAVTVSQLNAATSTIYLAVDASSVTGSASAARNSLALGANASAESGYSLAIGNGSLTNDDNGGEGYGVAVGFFAKSKGGGAVAVGPESEANGVSSVAVGDLARSSAEHAVSVGQESYANATNAMAIGAEAYIGSGSDNSIGLGFDATVSGSSTNALALGYKTIVSASNAVAIGAESVADEELTVSFGRNESEDGADNAIKRRLIHLADGEDDSDAVTVSQLNAVSTSGTTYMATSFDGNAASATGTNAFAVGAGALAQGTGSIAIGGDAPGDDPDDNGAQALGNYSFALGANAKAASVISFAIGAGANAEGVASLAIGTSSGALGGGAVALGNLSSASGDASTAIGAQSGAGSAYSIAVGYQASTGAQYAAAIGPLADASHLNSMAIGYQAATSRANQIVIGTSSLTLTIPGLPTDASNNAQGSSLYMVTVDADGNLGFAAMPGTTNAVASAPVAASTPAAAPLASNASAPASSAAPQSATSATAPASTTTSSLAYDATSTDGGPTSSAQSGERIASAEDMSSRAITDSEDRNLPEQMELAEAGGNASETAEQETGQLAQSDPDQNVPEPPSTPDTSAGTRTASTSATGSSELVAAVTEEQFNTLAGSVSSLDNRVTSLESRVQSLEFRLEDVDRRARGGIAAAAALGSAIAIPDKSFVITGNVATYRGETGYAMSVIGRASESLAFSAGIAGNTGEDEVIAQAGFALGF